VLHSQLQLFPEGKNNVNMKKPKFKIKISPKQITFWFYFLVIILSLAIFAYTYLFLKNHFYDTITQSKDIIILKEKVASETINVKKFDDIMEKLKQKTTPRQIKNLNNPFD